MVVVKGRRCVHPEEVEHYNSIYLLRNGIPTNYVAPNFDPPYTTKMTRSLLLNVFTQILGFETTRIDLHTHSKRDPHQHQHQHYDYYYYCEKNGTNTVALKQQVSQAYYHQYYQKQGTK